MKRDKNVVLDNLYQQYAAIGKKIANYPLLNGFSKKAWDCLAQEGLWKLPIRSNNGGDGLTWQAFVSAIEGLSSTYKKFSFFRSIVSQASVLYLLEKYGTERQKNIYLSRLLQGEMACVAVNESFDAFDASNIQSQVLPIANRRFQLTGHKLQIPQLMEAHLLIVVVRNHSVTQDKFKSIRFFIVEKSNKKILLNKKTDLVGDIIFNDLNLNNNDVLGDLSEGFFMLNQLFEFERILYGLLAVSFVNPIIDKYKTHFHEKQTTIMRRINECGYALYKALDNPIHNFN
jgi:alkylation response protein AidB-like acyl-CoA dehydrogenase